jgi:hypothetical protein
MWGGNVGPSREGRFSHGLLELRFLPCVWHPLLRTSAAGVAMYYNFVGRNVGREPNVGRECGDVGRECGEGM